MSNSRRAAARLARTACDLDDLTVALEKMTLEEGDGAYLATSAYHLALCFERLAWLQNDLERYGHTPRLPIPFEHELKRAA